MKKTMSMWALTAAMLSLAACAANTDSTVDAPESTPMTSSVGTLHGNGASSEDAESGTGSVSSEGSAGFESLENSTASLPHEKPNITAADNGGEMSGSVFVLDDGRGIVLFGGSWSGGQSYAETLNQYKAALGENVNVFSMVVPTAVSFYLPEKYSYMTGSEWEHIENINDYLDGVIPVDAYTELAKHVDEEIYLRTDNHWQALGAYYAAKTFAETALADFPELNEENFEFISRDGYVGTLYGYSEEDARIRDNPETFTYYKPKTEYTCDFLDYSLEYQYTGAMMLDTDNIAVSSWYMVNMCGDMYSIHVKTAVKNARKLLIVKDSYGDALPAFLTKSFEEIWVVDMRHFEKSVTELCKSEGITDVLFAMNASSATGINADNLVNIF
ncbi:MAG: hypothetical protein K2N38_07440 [Oscillospiraceae bacterium]|nr:hypothetical protein [Oscillospiraceae bacterium]